MGVGVWAGLDGCGKSTPTGNRSPNRPVRSIVAIEVLKKYVKEQSNVEHAISAYGVTVVGFMWLQIVRGAFKL